MTTPPRVALETTLLVHGVPRSSAKDLARDLNTIITSHRAAPALVGIVSGRPIVAMSDAQLDELLALPPADVRKVNTANLGAILASSRHGATTVSATMELAAGAGVSVFATGGIGGVHPLTLPSAPSPFGSPRIPLDISSDLFAFTRFPVAVVTSGVKSILDVAATRELLETLGVPVVGFHTSDFPAFYLRRALDQAVPPVDENFTDITRLARFVRHELARTGRGIVVCNPIPETDEISRADWTRWLTEAESRLHAHASPAAGRDVTPALLSSLHAISAGATLKANIALVRSNAALAARLAHAMATC